MQAMPENKTTNERIFDKLETITGQYGEIKGRLDVIDEKLEHKPDEVDMIKFVDKRIVDCNQNHKQQQKEKENSKVVDVSQYRGGQKQKDFTPLIIAIIKVIGLLAAGTAGGAAIF